jgi:hypothetical protein
MLSQPGSLLFRLIWPNRHDFFGLISIRCALSIVLAKVKETIPTLNAFLAVCRFIGLSPHSSAEHEGR